MIGGNSAKPVGFAAQPCHSSVYVYVSMAFSSLSMAKSSPFFCYRMYDVDGNGVIDQEEMTKIVQAIYDMLGAGATKPTDSAEVCTVYRST